MSDKEKHIRLSDLPKKDPFPPPAGYFDTLQERIDQRIMEAKRAKVVRVTWRHISYAVAASVILLVAVIIAIRQPVESKPTVEELIAGISFDDCLAYLESSDIEADEILQGTSLDTWDEALVTSPSIDSLINDSELDLLYERYGASPDETLQTL